MTASILRRGTSDFFLDIGGGSIHDQQYPPVLRPAGCAVVLLTSSWRHTLHIVELSEVT